MYDDPFEQGCDWVAISATRLQGVYTGGTELPFSAWSCMP